MAHKCSIISYYYSFTYFDLLLICQNYLILVTIEYRICTVYAIIKTPNLT